MIITGRLRAKYKSILFYPAFLLNLIKVICSASIKEQTEVFEEFVLQIHPS